MSRASSFACAWPVRTCVLCGSTLRTDASSRAVLVPAFAEIRIASSRPCFPNSCCAVGTSKIASVAPPIDETAPNFAMPVIRNCWTAPVACTPIVSPTR